MSWVDVVPLQPKNKEARNAAVTVSLTNRSTKHRAADAPRWLFITVRPHLLDGGLPFWTLGAPMHVRIGEGEHAGQMRIDPGGPHRITRLGGRLAPCTLSLAAPAWIQPGTHAPEPVEHDWNDGWLELKLPAWAQQTAAAPAPDSKRQVPVQPIPTSPPPPPPPAPTAPAPEDNPVKKWTPERRALLCARWALPTREIVNLANRLPGPPLNGTDIAAYGLSSLDLPLRGSLPVQEPLAAAPYAEIRDWSAHASVGIVYDGSNIAAVNRRREAAGLRPFVQIEDARTTGRAVA
jgi:hypothetical protein